MNNLNCFRFFPLALAAMTASGIAQTAISRNHVTLNPVVPGSNGIYPMSANVLPSGQFATSSYLSGPTATGSHFCAVNRTTGAFSWIRSGVASANVYGSAVGPGGRVGQFGYAIQGSTNPYNSLMQGWNGIGSSLFTQVEKATMTTRNEIATAMAFDSAGNYYIAGYAYEFASAAGSFSFIAKYSASGTRLWTRQSGLSALVQVDIPIGLGVDSSGDVWAAIARGSASTHVWKLNSSGTTLFGSVWQINAIVTQPVWAGMVNNRFVVAGNNAGNQMFVRQYITTTNWLTSTVGGDTPGFENLRDVAGDSLGNIHLGYRRTSASPVGAFRTVSRTNVVSPEALFATSEEVSKIFVDSVRNIYLVGWQPDMGGRMALASKYNPARSHIWSVSGPQLTFTPVSTAFHEPSGEIFVLQKNEVATPERMTAFFVSQAPGANADFFSATRNVLFSGNVRNNDRFAADATVVLITSPAHGSLTLGADGAFTFTSTGVFTGVDSFTYRLDRPGLTSSTTTAAINIAP